MADKKPKTVDEYIAGFPGDIQAILNSVRQTIREAAPHASEVMTYGVPGFRQTVNLVQFAAFKEHIGFYPTPSAIEAFKDELSLYHTSEGTVRFPIDEAVPLDLIRRMVEYRVSEVTGNR